ncbi:TPA: hypothetical protein PR959_001630 [Staphylococcus aureus]|nr:hypothetical protein [Staphylococcus aureus]HDE8374547.1 hypothetical protein [Staphylococcus aureus]HDG4682660.1 hypothetical protein [Staphylococcus aureus]HDK3864951.1 hypothetical protein [Staphylococcus aureus]
MARTKTQKQLTIAKTKSENIVEWFVNDAHWKVLSENLELGKTAIFKYKKNIQEIEKEDGAFAALSEIFTLKQLNTVISVFNDYIEHPEKYEKPRKKSEINLKEQEDTVKKHMKDMNMDYLSYNKQSENEKNDKSEETAEKSSEKSVERPSESPKEETKEELLARQSREAEQARKEINELPKDSPERAKKEAEFERSKAKRINEFWEAQKKEGKVGESKPKKKNNINKLLGFDK